MNERIWAVGMMLFVCVAAHAQQAASTAGFMDDPTLGQRWTLVKNAEHPNEPGHWELSQGTPQKLTRDANGRMNVPVPMVRAGQRVTVVQRTSFADARFDAVAMTTAMNKGDALSVRLRANGRVVEARAVAQNVAEWVSVSVAGGQQ